MATIKIGQQGGSIVQGDVERPTYARPGPQVRVGEGIQALGQTLQRMGKQKQQEAEAAENAQAGVAQAKFQSSLKEAQDDLLEKERAGEIKVGELDDQFNQQAEMAMDEYLSQFPEERRERYRPAFEVQAIRQKMEFTEQQRGRIAENNVRAFEDGRRANAQIALTEPARAIQLNDAWIDNNAAGLNIPAAQVAKVKAADRDRAWENNARNIMSGRKISDVKALRKRLDDKKLFPGITPETWLQLKEAANSRIEALDRELESDASATRAQQSGDMDSIADYYMSGEQIPVQSDIEMRQIVANTPDKVRTKAKAKLAIDLSPKIQEMTRMSRPERDRLLNDARTAWESKAGVERVRGRDRYEILRAADERITRQKNDDPWGMSERVTGEIIPAMDYAPNADIPMQMKDRARLAPAVQTYSDGHNPGLLKPAERAPFAEALSAMTTPQSEQFFVQLNETLTSEPERAYLRQTFKDLRQTNPTAAVAGMLGMEGQKGPDGLLVGTTLLRGQKAVEVHKIASQSDAWFKDQLDKKVGNAFQHQEERYATALKNLKYYYTATAATAKEKVDSTREESATFNAAFNALLGPMSEVNGAPVFLPYDPLTHKPMDDASFREAFDADLSRQAREAGFKDETVRDVLEKARPYMGDGEREFKVLYNGTTLQLRDGEDAVVRVNPSHRSPKPKQPPGLTPHGLMLSP